MTVTEEFATDDDDTPKVDLTAPDTRAAGRWNSAGMPTERSAQFGTAVKRLFHLLGPERPILGLVALTAIVSAVLNVFGPLVLGHATDVLLRSVDREQLHRLVEPAVDLPGDDLGLARGQLEALAAHHLEQDDELQLTPALDLPGVGPADVVDADRDVADQLGVEPVEDLARGQLLALEAGERRGVDPDLN